MFLTFTMTAISQASQPEVFFRVRALYPIQANQDDELTLTAPEELDVLRIVNQDWFATQFLPICTCEVEFSWVSGILGETAKDKAGYFP